MMTGSSEPSNTYDLSLLEGSSEKWKRSKALQTYYKSLFKDLLEKRIHGSTLEIGSGCSFIKSVDPEVITSDLRQTPYSNHTVDAYAIEKLRKSWANIIAIDVLHHLETPMRFFNSVAKNLMTGGRLILCEPAATPWGNVFYRLFHEEPCNAETLAPPFESKSDSHGFFANMGAGWALFKIHRSYSNGELDRIGLNIKSVTYRDLFAYPLTGGFSKPSMVPAFLVNPILAAEAMLPQKILKIIGLRMVIVIEKRQ